MAQIHSLNDEHGLVQRLQSSDAALRNAAFREFVRSHMQRLYTLAYKLSGNADDADDLTQEVFVRAVEALPQFSGSSSLATWLHRIAVNLHIDFTRSGRYRYSAAWDDERDNNATTTWTANAAPLPDASTHAAFQQTHFENALKTLSPQQRTVVVLRFVQEYSLEEIAEELGVSVGTVKTLVFRAVRSLREALRIYEKEFSPSQHLS
ncbi:MAG: sigma-70 family RNA polymerase sigma factor [Candidatus Kapabacteria bacterium]|jgi:RNA polymerase sigma-70 factor (ECF subfamily)|nr:sigma-70 family RNA polymerase sigma factor [Candidatus Kapabacteria bacterium]